MLETGQWNMGIIGLVERKYLQGQKEKQAQKLAEVRKSLRKTQSGSPQLRSMVQPELERVRQLSTQLRKVRSREDLKSWRALYEMCRPAFEVTINLAPPKKTTRKRSTKGT